MAWFDRGPRDQATPSLRSRARSLYEGRFRRAEDPADKEPLLDERGFPTLVVVKGECIGYRAKDGSLIPAPELPRSPTQWPEEMWEEPDVEFVLTAGGWRKRWRP